MATPIVHDHVVHDESSDDTGSSADVALVLLVAIVVVGFLLYAAQALPFNGSSGSTINVDVPDVSIPTTVETDGNAGITNAQ